jgi:hypothetical protein
LQLAQRSLYKAAPSAGGAGAANTGAARIANEAKPSLASIKPPKVKL